MEREYDEDEDEDWGGKTAGERGVSAKGAMVEVQRCVLDG